MKKIFFLFIAVFLFAYDAKVEPFDSFNIKSSVAGSVVFANKSLENRVLKRKVVLKLDTKDENIQLNVAIKNLEVLENELKNFEDIVKRKKAIYLKYKNLKTKSQIEKDMKFFDYLNSYNQLLSIKTQIQNTKANIEKLKDTISKKKIVVNGYLDKLFVNRGDYVMPGSLVAKVYDISKEKLTIFVPIDKKISKSMKVYINGKKSNFKIYKIWKMPDSEYVTSYKVEIVGKGLKLGEVVRVDLKDR